MRNARNSSRNCTCTGVSVYINSSRESLGRDTRVVPSNNVLNRGPNPIQSNPMSITEEGQGPLFPSPHGKGGRIGDRNPQSKFALQIAAKPLHTVEWLLQTVYRNSATPYPTVPSPTLTTSPFPENNMFAAMPPSAKWLWSCSK